MTTRQTGCPGCSGAGVLTDDPQVLRCQGCGGVFTDGDPITFEQAQKFVALHLPMVLGGEAMRFGDEPQFYFDLVVSTEWKGKPEVARIHGWADTRTKRVVQFG